MVKKDKKAKVPKKKLSGASSQTIVNLRAELQRANEEATAYRSKFQGAQNAVSLLEMQMGVMERELARVASERVELLEKLEKLKALAHALVDVGWELSVGKTGQGDSMELRKGNA